MKYLQRHVMMKYTYYLKQYYHICSQSKHFGVLQTFLMNKRDPSYE